MAGGIIKWNSGYRYNDGHRWNEPPAFVLVPEKLKGPMPDFIPRDGDAYIGWITNLKTEIEKPDAAFGLTEAQITAVVNKIAGQLTRHTTTEGLKSALSDAMVAEKQGKTDLDLWLRTQINSWKLMPTFTDALAARLRVVGTSGSAQPAPGADHKVKFSCELVGGEVRIKWTKGQLDAVNIYTRRRGETKWTKIGMDTSSPYLDSRPLSEGVQAEVREYMLRGVINDVEVTGDSDIEAIAFPG